MEIIKSLAKGYYSEVRDIRRYLHQHPELSFKEHNTCQYIASKLKEWGIRHHAGMAGTGVCAWIEGQSPEAAWIALRADIDALPIQEENEVPYRSCNPGVMHACGHDVHTSSLLGTAKILHQLRDQFSGTVQLIFQPGEEQLPGGASMVLSEGWLDNPVPSCILGQHVEPGMELGKVGFCEGQTMASADEIRVTVRGKGGHAARPHQCVDTVLMTSQMIVQLQQIVSRYADPLTPSVLSFGKIYSEGGATNIIPEVIHVSGTFRTFDEEWRYRAHDLMKNMAQQICKSMGGTCDFDVQVGYPFVFNDIALTQRIRQSAVDFLGSDKVVDMPARMGGEDFAFYSQKMPASFYRLGAQNPNGTGLHNPTFDISEPALELGMGLMAQLSLAELDHVKNS